jgi:hypothetical protein
MEPGFVMSEGGKKWGWRSRGVFLSVLDEQGIFMLGICRFSGVASFDESSACRMENLTYLSTCLLFLPVCPELPVQVLLLSIHRLVDTVHKLFGSFAN